MKRSQLIPQVQLLQVPWAERRYTLVSLLDMILILGNEPWVVLHSLDSLYESSAAKEKKHGGFLSDREKEILAKHAGIALSFAKRLLLPHSRQRLTHFQSSFTAPVPYAAVVLELHGIRCALLEELGKINFGCIHPIKACYCENETLFGQKVNDVFPLAAPHIKAAGNCLAVELHTAAVFHLMIAVEFALRRLARRVRVRMKSMGRPLEESDWGAVISSVDRKLNEIEKQKRSTRKSHALEFYRAAVRDLKALKDIHRNPLMHALRGYTELQALDVVEHVMGFMIRLANHLKK